MQNIFWSFCDCGVSLFFQMAVWRWRLIVTWRTTSGRTWTTCLTSPQNRRAVKAHRHGNDPVTATTLWTCAHLMNLLTVTERHRDPEKVNFCSIYMLKPVVYVGRNFFSFVIWNGFVGISLFQICAQLTSTCIIISFSGDKILFICDPKWFDGALISLYQNWF